MTGISIRSERAFDAGVSGLAGLSAAFVAFAMPDSLFSGLIAASPLPALVATAQPPFGDTARLGAVAGAGLFAFALVWALMAAVSRRPRRTSTEAVQPAEPEAGAPRLRRADAHPDAPSRRPLVAGRDLGEPVDAPVPAPAPARTLPPFLVPEPETVEAVEAEPIAAPLCNAAPEPEPDPELVLETEAAPEPIAELAARLPDPEPQNVEPIAQLVGRVEFGLARKRRAIPEADEIPAAATDAAEPAEPEEPVRHRLRSAINDLQKMAARGG